MLRRLFKPSLILLAGLPGTALLIGGLSNYPGSKLVYMLFTVVFWLMLIAALGRRTGYGYLYLAMALWMGFWGKITAHLILKYPYVESIGQFDGSANAWDRVLWVAIVASAGVMLSELLFTRLGKKYSRFTGVDEAKVPVWYSAFRGWVWSVTLVAIVGFAAVNLTFGIQQIGLVPRTILPWPLNAVIAWQVSIGSSLLLAVLLWWEVSLKKSISVSAYTLLIEGITSTTSLLSRGVYVFHTIPQFFSLYSNRKLLVGLSKTKVFALMLAFTGLMVLSISGVTTFRAYLYPHSGGFTTADQIRLTRLEVIEGGIARVKKLIAQGEPQEDHLRELLAEKLRIEDQLRLARLEMLQGGIAHVETLISQGEAQEGHLRELQAEKLRLENSLSSNEAESTVVANPVKMGKSKNTEAPVATRDSLWESKDKLLNEFHYQIDTGSLPRILSLAVDRWIGLEGVMAVSAYPEKSNKLLLDAITEKRGIGTTTKYQEIANSHYRWVDANIWQFASLPGAAAFFYFSGSLWVVMSGMAIFALVLQVSEQLIFRLTSNPLLCSMFGLTLANTITQFGVTPRQDIPFYSMIFGFLILVWIMQSDKVSGMYVKYASHRGKRGLV